jgi:hypothetical protein
VTVKKHHVTQNVTEICTEELNYRLKINSLLQQDAEIEYEKFIDMLTRTRHGTLLDQWIP